MKLTRGVVYQEAMVAAGPGNVIPGLVLSQILYWFEPASAKKPNSKPILKKKFLQKYVKISNCHGGVDKVLFLATTTAALGRVLYLTPKSVSYALAKLRALGLIEQRTGNNRFLKHRNCTIVRPNWAAIQARVDAAGAAATDPIVQTTEE